MKDDNLNAFFVGSLIASVVGAVMLLVDDFGGWYYQISFAGVPTDRYEYIGLFSVYFPVAAVLAGALLYSGYASFLLQRSKDSEPSAPLVRRFRPGRLEHRMEAMQQQLEELRESLEWLRTEAGSE